MLIGEKRLLTVYDDILNVVGQGRGKNQWNSVADLLVKISLVSQKNSYLENYAEVVNITRRIMKLVRESKVVSSSSMIGPGLELFYFRLNFETSQSGDHIFLTLQKTRQVLFMF